MTDARRPVVGFEGKYSVDSTGRVYSHLTDRVLRFRSDRDGYQIVDLTVAKGRTSTKKVHRLVAEAFIGPAPDGKGEVDHINGVRDDNRVDNLRWLSVAANRTNKHKCLGASGVVGVRHRPDRRNPWQAYQYVEGRFRSLGHFSNKESAVAAKRRAVEEICNV